MSPESPARPGRRGRDDTLVAYLGQIGREPLLDRDEERDLILRAQAGDEAARSRLIRANLCLVVKAARDHASRARCLTLAEMIAEGNFALVRAVNGYKLGGRGRFSTYVYNRVQWALVSAVRDRRLPIRAPLHAWGGYTPQTAEVVAACDIVQRAAWVSAEALEFVPARESAPEESPLKDVIRRLDAAIDALGEDAWIIRSYHGLGGADPLSLRQIGGRLGLTFQGVAWRLKRAHQKLRHAIGPAMAEALERRRTG